MQNIESFVIWPNRSAKAEDYMDEGLGLNEREFEWVKHPRGKLEVMLKRKGAQSVILNTDLSCLGEHLHLLATGTEKVRFAEDLMRQHDDDWLSKYLQHYKAT
jgi:type IV secretion system protein VirB4